MANPDPAIGQVDNFEPQAQPERRQRPLANYQFSSDELRVLRECNTESFFQRSLPIGTSLGVATYFGVKQGYLKANPRYGAVPKIVASVIVGYFLGKFSYQRQCAEKIMQLPNSRLGQILRQNKQKRGLYESISPDQGLGAGFGLPFTSPNPDVYSDADLKAEKGNSLDLDLERPIQSELDDIYRPTLDSPPQTFEGAVTPEQPKTVVTYDELRRKNREEYAKKSQSIFNRPLPPDAPTVIRSYEKSTEDSQSEVPKQKNRYGDVWT